MSLPLDLDKLRRKLSAAKGPLYWRSLEQLAETPEFQAFVEDEFPNRIPDWNDAASRRNFLRVMAASLALGGAAACTKQPAESIVPYVRQPQNIVPGKPLFYATASISAGLATGVLVESHLGRPTKIEGNPDHPASLGATTPAVQASVLTLYDPDRSQTVLNNGYPSSWANFITTFSEARDAAANKRGAGLRILTGTVTSPSMYEQIQQLLATLPQAKWHQWEPCGCTDYAGSMAAFGSPLNAVYRLDRASRIVSLDADFLGPEFPGNLRYARDYANRRRMAADNGDQPSRLYVVESTPSITGAMADHRVILRSADMEAFGGGIARALGVPASGQVTETEMTRAIAKDLRAGGSAGIVIPGQWQSPRMHAIAHAINQALASTCVYFTDRVEATPVDQTESIRQLVTEMRSGAVDTLLILGGNPVYDAPADLGFVDALERVKFRAHLGQYCDETGAWCHWHVPQAHYLESWSDARAYDGTLSIVQPLIAPIYEGKTPQEILSLFQISRSAHDIVRDYWSRQHRGADFTDFWQTSLHNGIVAGSALPERRPPQARIPQSASRSESGVEIIFRPDPTIGGGELSNNAWLQETPKPQNKMTWDNAVWIAPATAQRLTLERGDIVRLALDGREIQGPVWIQPGHAEDSLTVHFGYGRTRAGRVADRIGFDAYRLRAANALWGAGPVDVRRVSGRHSFATTQIMHGMEDREPVRVATFDEYRREALLTRAEEQTHGTSLFPMWSYPQHKWGMSIDLHTCIGCNACMVACQSENNIPVVGKEQVAMGRHMNWIRVDTYFNGSLDTPETYFQPVPCMHCETAPCELVCPVAATVHSAEGLNEMVYNRCVGTRYCSNNCPYKVRRFNFLLYSDWYTESLHGARNPDVSVRSRGVMEKCTYCVQRIEGARIEAKREDRPIRDGEIVPACAQACPTEAIVFGDLNDPNSKVSQRKRQQRNYGLLEDLNTFPRTTYLARLRNPNPELNGNA